MSEPQTYPTDDGGVIAGHVPGRYLDADGDGKPDYAEVEFEESPRTALQSIPKGVRLGLYVAYALAGPVLIYLSAKGYVGTDEWALYAGVGTVFGITATGNVTR